MTSSRAFVSPSDLDNFLLNQARESYGQAKSYIWTENLDSRRISRLGCY